MKGGYTPDAIVVRAGKPVRLNFRREETASCSDKVIFADFNKSAELPTGETVTVELLPKVPGEYAFSGSGLGLSIFRKLVEAMGSMLDVETESGQGTRFFFVLDLPLAGQPQFG